MPDVPDVTPDVPDVMPDVPDVMPNVSNWMPEVSDVMPDVPDVMPIVMPDVMPVVMPNVADMPVVYYFVPSGTSDTSGITMGITSDTCIRMHDSKLPSTE